MYRVVLLQAVAMIAVALVAGGLVGIKGGVSAIIGGSAYILPNLLFVVRLSAAAVTGRASSASFFVGELGKILVTIGILATAPQYIEIHWISMLAGLFAALKANLFAFLLKT